MMLNVKVMDGLIEIDPYGWLQWYFRYWLDRRSKDDERQINRWKGIVNRFKGKLVKMIKDGGSKFDDYSISPKIRQILYQFNRQEILQKAKERYSKDKAAD